MLAVIKEMMASGMRVDLDHLAKLSKQCLELMQQEAAACAEIAGCGFNPNSDTQVRELVYNKLGFDATKLTKGTREASTNDKELSKVNHPVVKHILEYRKVAKIRDSYTEKLPRFAVKENGLDIIHCTIKLTGTDTGRLKVIDPPLQTIPVRSEIGKQVRNAFLARPGCTLLFVDLSQIEMRVLAHVSQCVNLIKLFNSGGDIHTDTAVKVFGVSREAAKEDRYRKPIKNVNFGVVYGISPQGLYNLMVENEVEGWTLGDCEKLITDYYTLYPEIKDYTDETIDYAYEHGYTVDMFGRRRLIAELKSPFEWVQAEGERQAGNMPIQAGAQGILKLATNAIYRDRPVFGLGFKFLMQIHDELVLEVTKPELIDTARFVLDKMETTTCIAVPIRAEAKAAERWGEAESVEGL